MTMDPRFRFSTDSQMQSTTFSLSTSSDSKKKTIALFGANSKTGAHFLRLALDAGYEVRALLTDPALREEAFSESLQWVEAATYFDMEACKEVVQDTNYVVCMLQEAIYIDEENLPAADVDLGKPLTSFLQKLYPIMMEEVSIQVFLFQVRR